MEKVTIEEFLKEKHWRGEINLAVDQHTSLKLTHLDKVYWPDEGYTKADLLRYYLEMADYILPFLQDRPAILKRYPKGINPKDPKLEKPGKGTDLRVRDGGFFQQNVDPATAPSFLKTALLASEAGHDVNYAVYTDLASLIYLVNLGTIAHNPWHSRLDKLDYPDYVVFDLDPHDAPFENVLQLALSLRNILEEESGLKSYIKTSGSSGLHLFVPLKLGEITYQEVATFAEKIAKSATSRHPKIATLERKIEEREKQQVYVDWLQNARGKAVAAAYTVRAKPGATVSMPLDWQEVEKGHFKLADFTINTAPLRLKKQGDLWAKLFKS